MRVFAYVVYISVAVASQCLCKWFILKLATFFFFFWTLFMQIEEKIWGEGELSVSNKKVLFLKRILYDSLAVYNIHTHFTDIKFAILNSI